MYSTRRAFDRGLGAVSDINTVLMPDGSRISIGAFLAMPNVLSPRAEVQAHVAQNAWSFVAVPNGGNFGIQYVYENVPPATGSITVVGGQGNASGGVTPISATITPAGFQADTSASSAPVSSPIGAAPQPPPNPSMPLPAVTPSSATLVTTQPDITTQATMAPAGAPSGLPGSVPTGGGSVDYAAGPPAPDGTADQSGATVPLATAAAGIPSWFWILAAVGGFLYLRKKQS